MLEKGKDVTCEFTTPVQVLFNASKVFEGFNIKMRSKRARYMGRVTSNAI
jgi:hypothetical protein